MSDADAIAAVRKLLDACNDKRGLSMGSVGLLLDCSARYVREHLADFPNAFRLPGGDIRIPMRDVISIQKNRRIFQFP